MVLLSVAYTVMPTSVAVARIDGREKPAVGFINKLFKHRSDSLRGNRQENLQDTSKKIKEIAPAKRQAKPERINEPEGRPGIISRPTFPGIDHNQPQGGGAGPTGSGGTIQQPGRSPQGGSPGGGQSPRGGGGSPGGRRGG